MDARFSANLHSNGFKNVICHEGYATDTVFHLDSHSPGCFSTSKGVKRKWDLRDRSMEIEGDSSDSKASSTTGSTTMVSSPKETGEESSMDLEFDFSLHLDLELSLSSTPSESYISTVQPNPYYKKIPEDSSLSSNFSSRTSSLMITENRNNGTKICQMKECEKGARGGRRCQKPDCHTERRTAYGGGRRCWWGPTASDECDLFGKGESGLCTFHGALVQDKRVHGGGATVGTLVHDAQKDENALTEDMDVDDTIVMASSRRSSMVSERRVHGGSLIAYLASGSDWSTVQGKVNFISKKWI